MIIYIATIANASYSKGSKQVIWASINSVLLNNNILSGKVDKALFL